MHFCAFPSPTKMPLKHLQRPPLPSHFCPVTKTTNKALGAPVVVSVVLVKLVEVVVWVVAVD